jgi:hypothetical protein
MDYQRSYLEEKVRSCSIEMGAIQMRFQMLQGELANAQKELTEYQTKEDKENDSTE